MGQEERSIFWEVIISVILNKNVYMYMCPVSNGFRDRAISLYSMNLINALPGNSSVNTVQHAAIEEAVSGSAVTSRSTCRVVRVTKITGSTSDD
jgi:hypothetical protein